MYTRTLTIPPGLLGARTQIGGEAYEGDRQVGYLEPTRLGVVCLEYSGSGISPDEWPVELLTATIAGYDGRLVEQVDLPAEVMIELPCTVVIRPLVALALPAQVTIVSAPVGAYYRGYGQRRTRSLSEGERLVPSWARAVDGPYVSGSVLELGDAAGAWLGTVPAGTQHVLPTWARRVRAVPAGGYVTFIGGGA